jgi:hypothetical protein
MNMFKSLFDKIAEFVVINIGKIHWGYKNGLTTEELDSLRKLLKDNYYVIVTHRNNHLSTFFVGFASWVLTRKWSYWAHALLNLENEVNSDADFRLIEATGAGTNYSPFGLVFQVHGVALLKPKSMSAEYWTKVMEKANSELGKPYDSLFDLANDNALSCVELVRTALMAEPDYEINFANFETMIKSDKNLTPQMYYDCSDFEVVYEIRRQR